MHAPTRPVVRPTMTADLPHYLWKALRVLVRAPARKAPGHRLRVDMTRRTQDGSFLVHAVALGLLVVEVPDPNPFRAVYRLTPLGAEAAEYGECALPIGFLRTLAVEVPGLPTDGYRRARDEAPAAGRRPARKK